MRGGAAWDPGGAEEPTAESAGLRRRKALSTSGWLGGRTRALFNLHLTRSLFPKGAREVTINV